jgi:signal peptidase I
MTTVAPAQPAPSTDASSQDSYSRPVLVAGILGRTWLWFVAACLVITLLPMLIGWHPYTVKSGSMEPRIHVGDVLLAAPVSGASELIGRVAVFTDQDHPDRVRAHRIIAQNADGSLQSQGDANPTPDSASVQVSEVRGLGRLVVRYAGLPVVWLETGQWTWLALFLLSLVLAAWSVSRDHEDEPADGEDPPGGELVPLPTRSSDGGSAVQAAASEPPHQLSRRDTTTTRTTRTWGTSPWSRWSWRLSLTAVVGLALVLPPASAAFSATTRSPGNSWAIANWSYSSSVTALSPWLYWRLDETTGTTAADTSGNGRTGTYNTSAAAFTRGIVGALTTDSPNLAVTLNGTTACVNTTSTTTMTAPTQLTEVVWFKTTTTNGGKLLGFEMPRTGVAVAGSGGTYDRHLYMDGAGKVWFGVYNGGYFTISSPTALNNGAWHMAAATMGAGGMALWIDGVQVATDANTTGESTTGWFRAGCGNLAGWGGSWTGGNSPTTSTSPTQNRPFAGSLDEISVWQSVLTAAQLQFLYMAR